MKERVVRTVVPVVVGAVLAAWTVVGNGVEAAVGAAIPALPEDSVADVSTAVVISGYYTAAAALEKYVKPYFGWLLGLAKQPSYDGPAAGTSRTVELP